MGKPCKYPPPLEATPAPADKEGHSLADILGEALRPPCVRAVHKTEAPFDFVCWDGWDVQRTGVFEVDYGAGRNMAEAALRYARETNNPIFISFLIGAMIRKVGTGAIPPCGYVEAGFADRISAAAVCGSMN
jgi:hypothetical protein